MRTRIAQAFASRRRRHPSWNDAVCQVVRLPRLVNSTACREILRLSESFSPEPGRVLDGRSRQRSNTVRWLTHAEETRWVFEMMEIAFTRANAFFRFDLTGFAEPLQFVDYGPEGHIDWHLDCTREHTSTRKLVATLQLSPARSYKGGELQFSARTRQEKGHALGDVIVFPAFMSHRVTPVLQGRRRVLVGWAHGPAFR